jgi:hypothetical protein
VEVTNLSHPFYTGQHRIVDTENLVKKFEAKRETAKAVKKVSKRDKLKQRRDRSKVRKVDTGQAITLKDMLKQLQ